MSPGCLAVARHNQTPSQPPPHLWGVCHRTSGGVPGRPKVIRHCRRTPSSFPPPPSAHCHAHAARPTGFGCSENVVDDPNKFVLASMPGISLAHHRLKPVRRARGISHVCRQDTRHTVLGRVNMVRGKGSGVTCLGEVKWYTHSQSERGRKSFL